MITFTRMATAKPGKNVDVLAFANRIAQVAGGVIGKDVRVHMQVGGPIGRVMWSVQASSVDEILGDLLKIAQSSEYREMDSQGTELFVAGSGYDEIWREME